MSLSNAIIICFLCSLTAATSLVSVLNDLNEFDPLRDLVVGFLKNPRGFGEHCAYHVVFSLLPALMMWMISAGMPYVFAGYFDSIKYIQTHISLHSIRETLSSKSRRTLDYEKNLCILNFIFLRKVSFDSIFRFICFASFWWFQVFPLRWLML